MQDVRARAKSDCATKFAFIDIVKERKGMVGIDALR